jgi:CPA2 family monovalent cation:H+ antiporter-2
MMVAVSSTACVLRLLTDRAEIDSEHSRMVLGILLIQDTAVIPMMLLVGVMATGGTWGLIAGKLALALVLAAALIGLFYLLFSIVTPRLLLLPTWRKNRDLPILLGVIMATGSAWATHAMGLSPALGAFVAGVLLAVSPFAIQIRADVRPLTTLMVTMFFAAIGMFGDPVWVVGHWAIVAGIVLAIIVGKPLVIILLARAFGRPWRVAIAAALCLAQVGEFSFVLATIAQSNVAGEALMSPVTFRAMVSATIVTLLLTPYFVAAAPGAGVCCERILLRWQRQQEAVPLSTAGPAGTENDNNVSSDLILIVGFGPAGQRVAEGLMDSHQEKLVAIDLDPDQIEIARRDNLAAHVGDATHRDILEHAGIYRACAVVITVPDHATTRHLIHLVRDLVPEAFVIARCRYHILNWELLHAGAHEVVDEEDQLGVLLAAQVRQYVGTKG